MADLLPRHKAEIEPCLRLELGGFSRAWVDELEGALFNGNNAAVLIKVLPPFYDARDLPNQAARVPRLQQRAIQLLIKDKQYVMALSALRSLPERQRWKRRATRVWEISATLRSATSRPETRKRPELLSLDPRPGLGAQAGERDWRSPRL